MANYKMEWRKNCQTYRLDPIDPEKIADHQANGDDLIEYKKGQIINVEKLDHFLFNDLDKGLFFRVTDSTAYRLF